MGKLSAAVVRRRLRYLSLLRCNFIIIFVQAHDNHNIFAVLSNAATTLRNYNDIIELDTQRIHERIPFRVQVNDVARVLTAT